MYLYVGFQETEAYNSGDSVFGYVYGQHGCIEVLQVEVDLTYSAYYIHTYIFFNNIHYYGGRIVEDIQSVLGMKISFSITQDNSA